MNKNVTRDHVRAEHPVQPDRPAATAFSSVSPAATATATAASVALAPVSTPPISWGERIWRTKSYLFRIRDAQRKAALIQERLALREGVDLDDAEDVVDTDELRRELAEAEQEAKRVAITVTDMIGHLDDANQQTVITKRYLHSKSWETIAEEMDMPMRSLQKTHGQALILLDMILFGAQASNRDNKTTID